MATEEDTLEQAAESRRERLRALRVAQELMNTPDDGFLQAKNDKDFSSQTLEESIRNMKFRNYLPHDKKLQEGKLAPPSLPKFEDPVAVAPQISEREEDPFLNIAPKKPNWDLRRDVQKKLDMLEMRTQKAIFQLMVQEKEQRFAEESHGSGAEE